MSPRPPRPLPRVSDRAFARTSADARRRGSVLVLATVVVVLLAMMGAAFVQMSRLDRVSTTAMDNRSQDYEGSILRYIGQILADDVFDEEMPDGQRYLQSTNVDMEKYDYPWTNPNSFDIPIAKQLARYNDDTNNLANASNTEWGTTAVTATNDTGGATFAMVPAAVGGSFDDTWLASNEPDTITDPADPTWPHLTNLAGVALDLEALVDINGSLLPGIYAVVPNGGRPYSDTNVSIADMEFNINMDSTSELYGDADGDGIPDGLWVYAPIPDQFGLTYVMCVRIVDNSAMANVNTWTKTSGAAGYATASDAPRWYWPGDLDLYGSVVEDNGVAAGASQDVLDDILEEKRALPYTGTLANPSDPIARYRNWLRASRMYGNPSDVGLDDYGFIATQLERDQTGTDAEDYKEDMTDTGGDNFAHLDRSNEGELRWRGGLNRSNDNITEQPAEPIEDIEPVAYWRQDGTVATGYDDTTYNTIPAFFENEPRKRLTLYSGSADWDKVNLQHDDENDEISQKISRNMAAWPRISTLRIWPNEGAFGDRFEAVLRDFRDRDNDAGSPELTEVNGVYGMEYLPVVSEVYLQARYESDLKLANDPPVEFDSRDQVTWQYSTTTNEFGVAIELTNPWPWPIEIPDVQVRIGADTDPQREDWGSLLTLLGGITTLDGHQSVTLVQMPPAGGDDTQLPPTSDPNVVEVTGQEWPVAGDARDIANIDNLAVPNDARFPVRLLAPVADGGDPVEYQAFQAVSIPETVEYRYIDGTAAAAVPDGSFGYFQFRGIGSANGLSALTVRQQDVETVVDPATTDINREIPANADEHIVEFSASDNARPAGTQFNVSLKNANSPNPDNAPAALDGRVADSFDVGGAPVDGDEPWVIGNTGVIYRAGDITRMVLLGPTDTDTVADIWYQAADTATAAIGRADFYFIGDFMIDPLVNFAPLFGNTPQLYNTTGPTYGMELLDRVTTLSPANDGQDNDGDSRIDDDDEQLIPGRINLNTASRDLLARALPFELSANYSDTMGTSKEDLIDLIVATREAPDTAGKIFSTRDVGHLGIASLGELLEVDGGGGALSVLGDPVGGGLRAQMEDFNEYETGQLDTIGLGPLDEDGFANDREDQLIGLNNLNQVASVRSDVYTAYILVRGYPSTDFSQGVVEEYRLTAVFDRSVVHESRPLPLLRSVTVFRQPQ